jgi:hypothetical protein
MNQRTLVVGSIALLQSLCPRPATGQPVTWTVEPVPSVSIGTVDGADGDILVNPVAATALSDGTVVVRNSTRGTFEIRYFDERGRHQRTASRWGRGPYEFEFPLGMHRIDGDSILVVGEDGRFAVFGPRGDRVREGRLGLLPLLPLLTSSAIDSGHLALLKPNAGGMPEPGTRRDTTRVFVYDLVKQVGRPFEMLLGREAHYQAMDGGVAIYPVPFGRSAHLAAGGGMLWIGDNAEPVIRGYRPGDSGPVVEVATPFEAHPVSESDRSRMRDAYSSSFAGPLQTRWARYARSMEFPEDTPSFGTLETDRLGNLWIQEYEPPWAQGPQRWAVFSPDGVQMAEVSVPESALPDCSRRMPFPCGPKDGIYEIGTDYLLVPQEDEWGVRYVRRYEIIKP